MQEALALALSLAALPARSPALPDSQLVIAAVDSQRSLAPTAENVYATRFGPGVGERIVLVQAGDNTPRSRPKAVEYSNGYYTRLSIHRAASYAMLPMFVALYITGKKRLDHRANNDAPAWARDLHGPLAVGVEGLFAVNSVTGVWNLIVSRKDPDHRTRRYVHSISMLAAEAGFVVTGFIGSRDDRSQRYPHRAVGLASAGVATASYLMMLIWKD